MAALTPEFALAAACCRWPPAARDSAVRAAAAGVADWDAFLRVTIRQRIAGLVHAALRSATVEIPFRIAHDIAARAQRIALQNAALAAESVRLQGALDAARIPAVNLKGVALAQLAYGSIGLKHSRDIDILVPADRAEAALLLLERDGYVRVSPPGPLSEAQRRAMIRYGKEVELVHGRSHIRLELQWRLAVNPLLLQDVDAHAATQIVALPDGGSLRTLAPDVLFANLCVHGACHSWSRLKWLADLNALMATVDDAGVAHLYRYAQSKGAGLCAGQALQLCHRLLALPLAARLLDELRSNRRLERLVAIALRAMTGPTAAADRDVAAVARNVFTPFLLGQGWAYFAAQCRVASVGLADVIGVPLHPALHFLYPVLRIPLWLWRRAIAAVRPRR